MSRKRVPSKQALVAALRDCSGNMAAAARRFHCDRSRICHLVNDDPELRELVDELSESFIDEAENKLYEHIREGNVVACIFFLKTRARHRGYSERLELVPLQSQQIEVELGVPTVIEAQDNNPEALNADSPAVVLLEQ